MDAHVARRAGHRAHGPRGSERGRRVGPLSADRRTLAAMRGGARPAGSDRRRPRHRLPQRASRPRDHGAERQRRPRARRRPRPGGRAARRDLRPDPRPGARHARPARHGPAGHGPVEPADVPGAQHAERAQLAPGGRREMRRAARRASRAVPDRRLGRGHRGAARAGRVRAPDDLRRLLRHEGGARLRGRAPRPRRAARARLGRHARRPRRAAALDVRGGPARARRALRGQRVPGHHREPDRRADVARQAAREAPDPRAATWTAAGAGTGSRSPARTSSRC